MWHDFTGQTINGFKVIGLSDFRFKYTTERVWRCICPACGKETLLTTCQLKTARYKSCGCLTRYDLTGRKIGNLTVIGRLPGLKNGKTVIWECLCDCTNICYLDTANLLKKTKTPHRCARCRRKYKTRETEILGGKYKAMIDRCYNTRNKYYYNYGGRGIYVCDEWLKDENAFIDWSLSHGFSLNGVSLDRINNDGPYCPDNCRYADKRTQDNNKRTNHFVEVDGERLTLAEWGRELDIERTQMYSFSAKYGDSRLPEILAKFREINDMCWSYKGRTDTIRNFCKDADMSDNDIARFLETHRSSDLTTLLKEKLND